MKAISICVSQPKMQNANGHATKNFGQQMEVKRRFYSGELHQEAQRSIDLKTISSATGHSVLFLHCMLVNLYN